MDGIFGGIYIQDQSALVSAPKKSIGEAAQAGFEALEPILGGEDVVLKAAKPGLAGPAVVLFSQGQTQCRVYPQIIGAVAVLMPAAT